ncbi:SulP family inorganic anion transporter [Iodobacter fluviatilis]|uniref:Probable sulfate transporter Rv1739c/MT1781 n=1 Tax=Iodobacter fluviatilis TaxID=537 RepID=A0A377Q5N7_9NEIS|nr:SulP family inorganic anion transporter [Iodobacter fluviatilis]TCU89195.1 SulP family sulfate permease [Iodobacter fluviatilis]STQ90564.1 Probable sulfate transporter Rv1739c/MT1781 [Iodobacter fluviatilis]
MKAVRSLAKFFPIVQWLPQYQKKTFAGDLSASLIVAVLLIPQSLAYALLAGLPPQAGIYASILPLVVYAFFASSMVQSVGPMAISAVMTASALAPLAALGSVEYSALAASLALLSGLFLAALGLLRLGFMTQLLSHPVINGFTSGAAILIIFGQTTPLLGAQEHTLQHVIMHQPHHLLFGLTCLALLWLLGQPLNALLLNKKVPHAPLIAKLSPLLLILLITATVHGLNIQTRLIGPFPGQLPAFTWPDLHPNQLARLWLPAITIGLAGFLQSITIAQSLALKARRNIDSNQELIGLGAANIAAAASGGFPVSGGFSRTAVNAASGAQTPLAGVMTAAWIALAAHWLSDYLALLPQALLAATIILVAIRLIDFDFLIRSWRYDWRDGAAFISTAIAVLLLGAMQGIVAGTGVSLILFLYRSSQPHIAIVGRIAGTEHFRNINRFTTQTCPSVVAIRIDESLYFGNSAKIQAELIQILAQAPAAKHLLLILSAVNSIDYSAMQAISLLQENLRVRQIKIHLAEVKGPVMDHLHRSEMLSTLDGEVFLSAHLAMQALSGVSEDFSI